MLNNLKIQVFLNNDKLTRLKDENGLVLVKQKRPINDMQDLDMQVLFIKKN